METYIIIGLILIFICYFIWDYKRTEFVKQNSKCYKDLLELNKKSDFIVFQNKITLLKNCNSKAQFDNFQTDQCIKYLLDIVESDLNNFKSLRNNIKENIKKYDRYLMYFEEIVNNNPFNYDLITKNAIVNSIDFRKIEVKICEKAKLNPAIDVEILINIRYVSPQGRNHYHKCKNIDFEGLEYILALRQQKLEYRQTAKYQRSLMTSKLRQEVLRRDNFTCRNCGASPRKNPAVTLHVDHIKPIAKGGLTELSNLQTLCQDCNLGKGTYYNPNGIN